MKLNRSQVRKLFQAFSGDAGPDVDGGDYSHAYEVLDVDGLTDELHLAAKKLGAVADVVDMKDPSSKGTGFEVHMQDGSSYQVTVRQSKQRG